MRSRRYWFAAGSAAAVVLAVAGATAVLAQSGEGDEASFLDRVAEKLGIEPERLEQAIRDVRNEDVDAAVEEGDLTQEEADELKERLDEKPAFPEGPFGFPGPRFDFEFKDGEEHPFFGSPPKGDGPRGFGFGFGLGLMESVEELATFLGISQEQLFEELMAEDASLASVAEAHGKSRDELKTFINGEIDENLAKAVEDGVLTEERADQVREKLNSAVDEIIDMQFGFPWKDHFSFDFDFRFHGEEDEDGAPDETPAPQGGASDEIQRS